NHGLTTMHWRSSDEDAVFQAGRFFSFRGPSGLGSFLSSGYFCKNDERRGFFSVGGAPPGEDLQAYSAKGKRDRLPEEGMLKLLERLGARPWQNEFYLRGEAFRIERVAYPDTIIRKQFREFACKRSAWRG